MFGLRNKTTEPVSDVPAGPLDRIGRRSASDARPDGTPQAAPLDRQARLAGAAASLAQAVGPRLRSLVTGGASAGEVTRQAGLQAQVHFRSQGITLSPLELRGYVAEVLRPVLPATTFVAPEPVAPSAPEESAAPVEEVVAVPTPDLTERKPSSQAGQLQPAAWQSDPLPRTEAAADKSTSRLS